MAALPSPAILEEDENFVIQPLFPGKEYLLTLAGEFDGATVVLEVFNDALDDYVSVTDGTWTAAAEIRFVAPSNKARLVVTSADTATAVAVTLTPFA